MIEGGIAGVLLAVLYIFGACCFYMLRPMKLCGGKHASHGFFFAGKRFDRESGEGYTTRTVWILKPLVLFGFVILIVVSTIGIEGNADYHSCNHGANPQLLMILPTPWLRPATIYFLAQMVSTHL